MREKHCYVLITLLVLLLALAPAAGAQTAPATQTQTQTQPSTPEGIEHGGYNIQQSIEVGYRHTDVSGVGADQSMFNTFLNLQTGPRLLEQTFSMRSLNRSAGLLFDDLYVSSFGWGGDPNNAARMRMSKYKWYNFTASFRRDQNYFDYNLLGNPLNTAGILVNYSPHLFQVRRRMVDLGLTMAPQSKFSVRLGYSRNRADGPSNQSLHEGVDVLLSSPWNTTYDNYQIGIDAKFIPKTNISFDQFLNYGKNDTNQFLTPFQSASFSTGVTVDGSSFVDFGLPNATTACLTSGATYFRNCSGYTSYSRTQRIRTSTPTSQLSFQSHPHEKLELTGRISYSSTDLKTPFSESFTGLVTRTRERAFTFGGDVRGQIIAVSSDIGMTIHLTDKLSFSDTFRWISSRQPALWDSTENSAIVGPKTYLVGGVVTACPTSGTIPTACQLTFADTGVWAGVDSILYNNFLGYNNKWNTVQFEYRFSKQVGARVGYRFGSRSITERSWNDSTTPPTTGSDAWDLREHTALLGLWVRPNNDFRTNFEYEMTSNGGDGPDLTPASGFITRLSPTHQRHLRVRSSYSPVRGLTLAGTINVLQNTNDRRDIQYKGHNNNIGFSATYNPSDKVALDMSYNYNSYRQNAWMCYVDTIVPLPTGTTVSTTANPTAGCPTYPASSAPNYVYSIFEDQNHYGSFLIMFHPVKRVTANLGYGVTLVDGNIQKFNTLQPLGPLSYTYHQPLASFSVELAKNWSWNTYWNYDQYKEGDFVGPTLPRYFHDNRATLSLRYAF